ncbi:hypothetical protein Psal006b_00425 [Piscirickettsia salmonis]|uniref:Histidine kinase n=1 Tax=Piscirickettsia salmonis TaxID=1238 RepID=A0A1L6TER3_PISSA|nr:hypothetical protein [Piscirickettsia salmonis]ALB23933.1 histidine kinase [Piscirickettsia salmonis]ALT18687.1 hypothetical protein PSLF89_07585 [Piscirickettsia salmonis LF-89 = ATCC VR-1361]ALY03760.1 hypothetical protein AWE47_13570 [Piscirickettsia salmonis]AMA43322.1 hypothetical protein AWJ11_13795 [Piscirickettsia salmonis]AOS35792.1 hypothetical protein AVM72_10910 [Piscirickettsia salmonis]
MKILIYKFFLNLLYILICYGGCPYHAAYVVAIFTGGSFVTQEVYAGDTDSLRLKVKGDFRIYKDLESFFDRSRECMQDKKAQIII